jgi:hypothetical protein
MEKSNLKKAKSRETNDINDASNAGFIARTSPSSPSSPSSHSAQPSETGHSYEDDDGLSQSTERSILKYNRENILSMYNQLKALHYIPVRVEMY